MADDPAYVAGLATELREKRPDLLRAAEDDLQKLRGSMSKVADFLRNQTIPLDIRQNLAQTLGLPEPNR